MSWLRLPHSMCIDSRYDQCTRYCGTSGKTSLVESLSTVALAFLRMGKLHTTRLRRRERSIVWPLMPQEDSMPSQFKQQRPRPLRNGTEGEQAPYCRSCGALKTSFWWCRPVRPWSFTALSLSMDPLSPWCCRTDLEELSLATTGRVYPFLLFEGRKVIV